MVTFHTGDVFKSGADLICHQVNCQGIMEAGLAAEVKRAYPNVFETYKQYCCRSDESLLGHVLNVEARNGSHKFYIANLFAQRFYGKGHRYTDYEALWKCFLCLRSDDGNQIVRGATGIYIVPIRTIAIPYGMGCGLAGGDWTIVLSFIRALFEDSPYHVQIWKLDKPRF